VNGHVHYGLTKRWAIEEGFGADIADMIARADIGVDREFPGRHWSNKRYHFRWLGARRIASAWLREAIETANPVLLGKALHCEQDAISHGHLGHILHWPGIDIWERRGVRAQRRIEVGTRRMLAAYRDALSARNAQFDRDIVEPSASTASAEDIL